MNHLSKPLRKTTENLFLCFPATGSSVRVTAHFSDVENATTLLLSDDGATLYVGARDAVLSLTADQPGLLTLKQKVGRLNLISCLNGKD